MSSKQKLVRRIVFVSGMNGWSIAGMGVLGGLFSLLTGGWLGSFLCFLITVAGWMELKGRTKIKQGLKEAGRWLTASQIWLLLVIVFYAGFQLASFDALDPMAKFSPEMNRVETWVYHVNDRNSDEVFAKNSHPHISQTFYTDYDEIAYEEAVFEMGPYMEDWMSDPFELETGEEDLSLEPWMTLPFEAEEFIRLGMIDGLTVKVSRCGGLLPAKRQIELVEDEGLFWMASGLTDPDVSLAASLALFSSFALDKPAALNGPQFLRDDALTEPLPINGDRAQVPAGPGLGIEIDESKLNRLRERTK